MSTCIYITSNDRYTGKTIISLAVAYLLAQRGLRVGILKPFSVATGQVEGKPVDESVLTLKSALGLEEPIEVINPIVVESSGDYLKKTLTLRPEDIKNKVESSWRTLSQKYDVVLVLGYRSFTHMILGKIPEIEIAARLNCSVLSVVIPSSPDFLGDLAYLRHLCNTYGIELLGVVLNRVKSQVEVDEWITALELMGIEVLGSVPDILSLHNPTLRDIVRELGGKVLCCENALDTTFQHVLIGAMSPELASRYFRAIPDKIVVTGGDRADLIMLALETDTRSIILTGGVYPSPRIVAEAEKRNIPLIVVPYDTYTTIKIIHSICGKVRPGDKRIEIVKSQVTSHINIEKILEKITRRGS